MTDKGTIRIPRETYEKHNERRKDLNLTWEQYFEQELGTQAGTVWTEDEIRSMARAEAKDMIRQFS
jgi:hypothetical protein